jgi:ATP-dependent DNA helicase DinG
VSTHLELGEAAATYLRAEIARARGNEVCFAASVGHGGVIGEPRVVARGNAHAVLAAVRDIEAGGLVIHNHPSGDLTPSGADLEIAAQLYQQGLGLAITDNTAGALYVVVAPARVRGIEPLDETAIAGMLAPGGPIQQHHAAYEDRPAQRELAVAVSRAYNDGGIDLAEAGTGIGKSIAYLVPAILWAVKNRERTVVSTNTINLQEQLVSKDLPFLRRALGEPFRFALVKGRRNYVSIRRARLAYESAATLFDATGNREITALREWLAATHDGSLQDLSFTPSAEVWEEVASDSDVCMRARCPHFEACFYQRARRAATTADVLVVNHHLLFSDIAVRRQNDNYTAPAVLPPYTRVVLDEAHNVEDAATSHLGVRVSRRAVYRLLARLERRGKGVLPAIEVALLTGEADLIRQAGLRIIADVLRPSIERARQRASELFEQLERLTLATDDGVLRLQDDFAGEPAWIEGPAPILESLLLLLDELPRGLRRLRESLESDRATADAMADRLLEISALEGRIAELAAAFRTAFRTGGDAVPFVRWIERRAGNRPESNIAVQAAPIDIGPLLRDALFERMHTVVLTSATLTTRNASFAFVRSRLGLGAGLRVRETVLPAPFDFATQTLLAVPDDLPATRHDAPGDHELATAAVVEEFARASDGGLFVLFTSYRAMRVVAAELRRRNAHARWPLYVQGEAPRSSLLTGFVASGHAVLLGVASFWEGVDVPGQPLRGLVIPKLPFKVPTEPLTAARIENIENNGGNSFHEYMLPHAALRMKQGFGRLIRSAHDRGAVAILDRRILEKGYGRYILDTLPRAPLVRANWFALASRLREFYDETVTRPKPLTRDDEAASIRVDV